MGCYHIRRRKNNLCMGVLQGVPILFKNPLLYAPLWLWPGPLGTQWHVPAATLM